MRAKHPATGPDVVVGNLTCGLDGRWTALDGRLLYCHAKTAGVLYQVAKAADRARTRSAITHERT